MGEPGCPSPSANTRAMFALLVAFTALDEAPAHPMLPTKFCEYVEGGRASCNKTSIIKWNKATFEKMAGIGDINGPQAECMYAAATLDSTRQPGDINLFNYMKYCGRSNPA